MKKLYLVLIAMVSLFVFAPNAYALPNFISDDNVSTEERYDDNTFIAGNVVNVNSYINGTSFVAGNTIKLAGEADYSFVAGNTLDINGYVAKDLFAAGQNIHIKDVNLRSIYAAAKVIDINADLENLYLSGDTITLKGNYSNVSIAADKLIIDGEISGTLKINSSCEIEATDDTFVFNKEEYNDKVDVEPAALILGVTIACIIAKLIAFVNALIIGVIIITLFKNGVKNLSEVNGNASNTVIKALIGFGLLVGVPVASLMLLFTGFASVLGIIMCVLYAIALYVSTIIASIFIGSKLFKNMNVYLSYIIVLIMFTLISFIPVIGALVKFIMLIIGLGLMLDFFKSRVEIKEVPVEVESKPKKTNTKKKEK